MNNKIDYNNPEYAVYSRKEIINFSELKDPLTLLDERLPIAPAQIKAGNNSESLLNEIRQIFYSLYRSKEINKKVYNNILIQ